jgi:hypothetical protein
MEAISHLEGLGGSLPGGVGVIASPVSADHLDLWMPLEPAFDCFGSAVRQQVDDPMPL